MLWPVALPLLLAPLAPWLTRRLGAASGWVLALLPAACGLGLLAGMPPAGTSRHLTLAWAPGLGVELSFVLDGLSTPFALLVCLIGVAIFLHAGGYLAGDPRLGRVYAWLSLFLGAMLGLVLADDVIALFVFWELTGIASYLLVGLDHERPEARRGAFTALVVTGGGGLALLVGLLLLGQAATDLGLSPHLAGRLSALGGVDLRGHDHYLPILLLVLLGAFTKSAQVPFHFWLPRAMTAPTPVSAFLHSATMVKAGVYLLARLTPHLGGTEAWQMLLTAAGVTTMLTGATLAVGQRDLKRVLACSTVSVLGILVMLLGLGTEAAVEAAVVFLVAHALYKAALFLVVGNLDHATGTRHLDSLGGLARMMPATALAGMLAALSKAGAPPMFGFLGKELLYKAKLDLETIGGWLVLLAVAANVVLVATALLAGVRPFLSRARSTPTHPHEVPAIMLVGPLGLGLLGLFVGLFPAAFERLFGTPMVSSILGREVVMQLELWHGVNPEALLVLGLSVLTLSAGFALFVRLRQRVLHPDAWIHRLEGWGPTAWFELGLRGLERSARSLTAGLQGGSLRKHMTVALLALVAALGAGLWRFVETRPPLPPGLDELQPHELLVALLVLAGAVVAVRSGSRLAAVAALGTTGLGLAYLFTVFGAPDLAITLIMVETLTVLLFTHVFHRLPPLQHRGPVGSRWRDLTLALLVGTAVTLLVLATATVDLPADAARYYATRSLPEAYGRNVVNVVLVDFRALDTLGEIVVVAVAGLGVWSLLHRRPDSSPEEERAHGGDGG